MSPACLAGLALVTIGVYTPIVTRPPANPASLSDASAGCVCSHLRRSARAVTQFYDRTLAPTGLRATQFTLMTVVRRTGGFPFSSLADVLGMDRTTLTRNLRPLEREGLVKIVPGSDRRVRLVRLTSLGERKHAEAEPLWAKAQGRVTEGIGEKTWRTLQKDLSRTIAVSLEATAEQDEI
jgi:DNA-binding MarR family transcriptional regulator